jgi:hypothetical protein
MMHDAGCERQETEGRRQESESRKQDARSRIQDAGCERQETEDRIQESEYTIENNATSPPERVNPTAAYINNQ